MTQKFPKKEHEHKWVFAAYHHRGDIYKCDCGKWIYGDEKDE